MAIMRIMKTKDYTTISNYAAKDATLSLKAKGLFYYLMTKPDNWVITREGLRSQLLEGKNALDSALKELENAGYLLRIKEQSKDSGRFYYNSVLYENPMPENRTPENGTQVNTDKVNTELNKISGKPANSADALLEILK